MSTLWVHGTAVFQRNCIASRNIGPEITKGWGIFKRTVQETETKPLLETTHVEFKNLKIELEFDLFKEFCSKSDCKSLFEALSSTSFTRFLKDYTNDGIHECNELIHSAPWDGFQGGPFDGVFLDMTYIEDLKADFYSDCEPGEYPEEEQEFLAEISPNNFEIILRDQFFLDENEEILRLGKSDDWEILQHGSSLVRGGYFYEDPPQFMKFSPEHELYAKFYMQDVGSNLVDDKSLFEQIRKRHVGLSS